MAAFVLFCLPCFVWFDRHSNPKDNTMGDTMLSPFFQLQTLRTDQLITLPFLVVVRFCLVVLCSILVFVFFGLLCFLFWLCFFFLAS